MIYQKTKKNMLNFIHCNASFDGRIFFFFFFTAKILVHCAVGVSRSASLVLAYLMINHHLPLVEAIKTVKEHRWISPNRGFLKHLRNLDVQLRQRTAERAALSTVTSLTFTLQSRGAYTTSHDLCTLQKWRQLCIGIKGQQNAKWINSDSSVPPNPEQPTAALYNHCTGWNCCALSGVIGWMRWSG